ncbi:hypothetical protein A4D02_27495 [Niastella koreensis]|uniref:Lipoprotein n=2 Tax=Niastella koreensis TaxID=354356 RepID=G8TGY6_NIAKG|nr:hypothetical protein [Niastella koreensis]AEV99588.1 hypothetical protein Niako_3262 [Niastella koreensis GR20-10]OQP50178.1 hypothetical protein A4D02_27495 [Niastella koreensis]
MNYMKLYPVIGYLLLTACTSTRITHSWKSDIPTKNYNKILVLAISGETDLATRQKMEDHLVGDLTTQGYHATSSLKEYGPRAFRQLNEEAVVNKLQNSGFDAVITIVLLSKEKERYYVPGQPYYSPYVGYYRNFYGYYTTIYSRIYTPGYYVTDTKYFWESNLFDVTSKELIYSVQTESFDYTSSDMLAHEYGKMIVNDMVKKQVLIKKELVAKDSHPGNPAFR